MDLPCFSSTFAPLTGLVTEKRPIDISYASKRLARVEVPTPRLLNLLKDSTCIIEISFDDVYIRLARQCSSTLRSCVASDGVDFERLRGSFEQCGYQCSSLFASRACDNETSWEGHASSRLEVAIKVLGDGRGHMEAMRWERYGRNLLHSSYTYPEPTSLQQIGQTPCPLHDDTASNINSSRRCE